MKERLKTISEEFSYLNEEKRKIESKSVKTLEDLENLAAIEELYKNMTEKINSWANDKNKAANDSEKIEIKEKSLREQFEENRDKIDLIRNKSKSMQPLLEGTDKKRKDEILEQLGFVKTTSTDGREVRIHPSLVGTYYDLVKAQRKLTEQLNNEYYQTRDKREVTKKEQPILTEVEDIFKEAFVEEKTKNIVEQEIQNEESKNIELIESKEQELIKKKQALEIERDNILNNESGRKQFVKYKQQQYYVPRYYSGYFPVLLHEIEKIEKELNELKLKDNLSEEPIKIQEATNSEEKQVEKIMTEFFIGEQPIKEESVILESNSNENTLNDSFKKNILDKFEKAKSNQMDAEHLSVEIPTLSTNIESKTETQKVKDIFDEFLNLENTETKEEKIHAQLETNFEKTEEKTNHEFEKISKILENFTNDFIGEASEEKSSNFSTSNKLNMTEEELDDKLEEQKNSSKVNYEYDEISEEEFNAAYNKKTSDFDKSPIDTTIAKEEIKEKKTFTNFMNKMSEKLHNQFYFEKDEFEDEFEEDFEEDFEEEKTSNKILSGVITKVRKASNNMSKKAKISAALIATSLVILVTGIITNGKNKEKIEEPVFTTTEEQLDTEESMLYENALKNHLQELNKTIEEEKESLTEAITTETTEAEKMSEENSLQIGKTIKINESAKIYRNGYDAYLNESAFNPYYDSEDNRVILGVGIIKEDTLTYVFACDEDANTTINNLINDGGEVVSILTANKDRYLSDYDGNDILTEDEINAYAEGWYNLDGVKLENMKGKSM